LSEGWPDEDAVDLQEAAGGGVAEGWFEVEEIEALGGQSGAHSRHESFAFIEREERHLELYGDGVGEEISGSGEDLGFVALDVEFEEDVVARGGCGENVVEAAEGDLFFLEIAGVWRGGEVSVEHGEDGAGVGVDGDVDLGLAVGGSEGHAVGDGPEGVGCGGVKEAGVGSGGGFEGDDLAAVAGGSAMTGELAGVGADVEDEVDGKLGEEELEAESLRGVDAGLADFEAGGFGHGAESVFERGVHDAWVSRVAVGRGFEMCAARRMESMAMSQRG
jgi:hypothetical protein